jgi:hypothetical protein
MVAVAATSLLDGFQVRLGHDDSTGAARERGVLRAVIPKFRVKLGTLNDERHDRLTTFPSQ